MTRNCLRMYGLTKNIETNKYMMVLQYADGGNLREWLSRQKLDMQSALVVLRDIARGLAGIHVQGLCHHDFHPGNILFGNLFGLNGRPLIADFGLSSSSKMQESTGAVVGVLPYIAPEVLRRRPYTQAA